MENLKEKIRKELYRCALITQSREGVGMSYTFDKQTDAVMKIIEPLLTADAIVRRLAESKYIGEMPSLIEDARSYVATNPKEGGELK